MSLADYLAKNYLQADSAPKKSKKRKRKHAEANGLVIADDNDTSTWTTTTKENSDDDAPTIVGSSGATKKKAGWKIVGAKAPTDQELRDQEEADRIVEQAAADARREADEAEDAPVVDDTGLKMESGAMAGLQTGEAVSAQVAAAKKREKKLWEEANKESSAKQQETIYRDASGRIINIAMKRAEARKALEEAERKKREAEEASKGDHQRAEREANRRKLEEAKFMTVARGADDAELNDELKTKEVWNDPAMQFISKKKKGKSVTGKPLYQGAAAPNRYGIRPGYRWDGVNRGNGFETRWFEARNRKRDLEALKYAWEMDE